MAGLVVRVTAAGVAGGEALGLGDPLGEDGDTDGLAGGDAVSSSHTIAWCPLIFSGCWLYPDAHAGPAGPGGPAGPAGP